MSRDYSRSRSRSRSRDRAPEPRWDDQPRRRERQEPRDVRVYVGNLPYDVRERELDDLFYDQRPGKIRVVRSREGGAKTFAFVDFRSFHDADDAVYHRDGIKFGGSRIIVEVARGERGGRDGDRDRGRGRGRDGDGDRERKEKRDSDRKANLAKKRSNFGITVTNIADGTKWQDLKDHFTGATFADVKGSEGVVEFSSAAEAEAAVADKDQSTVKGAVIAVCLRESAAPAPAPADAEADAPADADADANADAPAAPAAAAAVSADADDDDDADMGPRDAPEAEVEETRRGRSRSGTR